MEDRVRIILSCPRSQGAFIPIEPAAPEPPETPDYSDDELEILRLSTQRRADAGEPSAITRRMADLAYAGQ